MNKAKMKSLPTLCFLLLCLLSSALDAQSHRWDGRLAHSIDLVIGGDFGFRILDQDASQNDIINAYDNRNLFENYKLSHRFGFNYYHGIGPNLAIKTGLRWANPGFSISAISPIDINQDINEIQKIYDEYGTTYRYNYQLLEIPLGLKFVLPKSVCNPFFEVGIAPNYYRKTVVEQKGPFGESFSNAIEEDINRWNFVGFLSAGGNFAISNSISGFTQMVGRYQINSLRKSALSERMISLGIEIGIKYYLQ
ncbi:MAG: hypothetical protein AAFP19_21370 [Bacteroidota bacterium]